MNNKNKYRKLCMEEKTIPIFSQDWWLDSVCGGENWGVCLIEKGGLVVGAMPYYVKKKYGFSAVTQPLLTPKMGPWLRVMDGKYNTQIANQKKLMNLLIDQLPEFDSFVQGWHHGIQNWLPFYWRGYRQTTNYTYIIDDLRNIDDIWDGLQSNIKREIKKAKNRFNLKIRNDLSIDVLLKLNKMTFDRQGLGVSYSDDAVREINKVTHKRSCGKLFVAEDEKGQVHAAVFIVWDSEYAYYIIGGGDPSLRNSGATSLCMWEAIKYVSQYTKAFDFEGSMLEPIEKFFRGFGAKQKPYFSISKTNSKILKLIKFKKNF